MTEEGARPSHQTDCRRMVIRLQYGVKGGCDHRATSTDEMPGSRTREATLDTFPPANGSPAVSPMEGRGGAQGPQPGGEGSQARSRRADDRNGDSDSNSSGQRLPAATGDNAQRSHDPCQLGVCPASLADGRGSRRHDCGRGEGGNLSQLSHELTGWHRTMASRPDIQKDVDLGTDSGATAGRAALIYGTEDLRMSDR
jgi:hypothetical protein